VKLHRDDHLPTIIDRDSPSRNTHDEVVRFLYRMRWVFVTALAALVPSYTAAPVKAKQTPVRSSTKASTHPEIVRNAVADHGSAHIPAATKPSSHAQPASTANRHSAKRTRPTRARTSPTYQQHPDPDRYQEIQKALAERGYFKGQVNGQWGDDSIDALKRFQADQKLPDDGKINALTLIGLGLGPKHENNAVVPAAAPPAAAPSTASPPAVSPDPMPKTTSDGPAARPAGENPQ
jgi:Putative peptidoglycan binding domain